MKKVTLKRLTLENWRAQNRTIDFSDKTIIRGANGAGKSTITDAFFWLLTGVDALDRTNYDLYDNTKEFTHDNAIPAVVEGTLDVDGVEYVFKRSAKQKWIRPRGKSEYVKDKSDEYTYYIDGLAVSAKVYKERIEGLLADTDMLKIMLNVRYYQTLDWKDLRKYFSELVGIIDDSELKGDYSSIQDLLEKHKTTDAVKDKLRQEINPLKKTNESIESEIKGMKSMLPDLDGVEEAERSMNKANARIAEIELEIMGLGEANKPFVEKRDKELTAIKAKKQEIADAEKEWNDGQFAKCRDIQKKMADIDAENDRIKGHNADLERQRRNYRSQIDMARQQYQFFSDERDKLAAEKDAAKAAEFDCNANCIHCGQPLPAEMLESLKRKFQEDRESRVKSIIKRGVRARDNRDTQHKLMEEAEKALAGIPDDAPLLSKESLLVELEEADSATVPFESSDLYGILTGQLTLMESQLTVVPEVNSDELIAEKKRIAGEVAELSAVIAKRADRERGEKTIAEKEKEKAKTGVELARLEGLFDKCVEREREWASIVRDRANKYLHHCKVEMTELSKAGELTDICTVTIDGVDVGVANTARQIVAGIDIAEAFQMNAGLNLPLFVDNAEQICDCNIPAVSNQLVLTYVDDKFSELSIDI